MDTILIFGIVITAAFLIGTGLSRFGLPRVASYLIVGALFSGEMLKSEIPHSLEAAQTALTTIALGTIAFLVGAELKFSELRRSSKLIVRTTLGQLVGAFAFTSLGLYLFSIFVKPLGGYELPLMLGAIAATTAPAATLAVIEEFKAKGRLTDTVLDVVILDDAFGILLFSFILGLVGSNSLLHTLSHALMELLGSATLGATLGAALGWIARMIRSEELRFPLLVGSILTCIGLTQTLELSPLLSPMILGLVARNFFPHACKDISLPVKHIEEFVFLVFFVLTGMHFNFTVFKDAFLIICTYVVLRAIGKYYGSKWGATWGGANKTTRNWIGFTLFPQAGVAVGLALTLSQNPQFREYQDLIMNVILGSTIIFGLIGPAASRWALGRARQF